MPLETRGGPTDQGFVSNDEGVGPVCCDERGAKLKSEALDLLVRLQSKPALWP